MTDATASIQAAIVAQRSECELAVAQLREKYDDCIAKLEGAIVALGGTPAKFRLKRAGRVKSNGAPKQKRTRAPHVDPVLSEDKQVILDCLTRGNNKPTDPLSSDAIVNASGLPKPRVVMLLRQLVETGAVTRSGKSRATTYRLAETKSGEAATQ